MKIFFVKFAWMKIVFYLCLDFTNVKSLKNRKIFETKKNI